MKNNKRIKVQDPKSKNMNLQMFDSQSCPICLQDYDLLRRTPMMICFNQHSTCPKCLLDLQKSRKCPICCQKLINKGDVKKNRLVCSMIQEMYRNNGQILLYSKNYTYRGQTKNGKRHGFGEQISKDGNFLKGNFVNGQLTGKCEVITKNGARFNGQSNNGRLQGVFTTKYGSKIEGNFDLENLSGPNCSKKYTNGDIYVGMVNKLKANGFGKLTFANGNTFEGYFEKDYIRSNGQATISGTFQLEINNGDTYLKQIAEQIGIDHSQSESKSVRDESEQSEESSISSDLNI